MIPLLACGRNAPSILPRLARDTGAAFQSDSLQYAARWENGGQTLKITIRYTNNQPRPVAFENCNGSTVMMLESEVRGGHWLGIWSPFHHECISPPLIVPPGADWSTALFVWVPQDDSIYNTRKLLTPGEAVYRIVWPAVRFEDGGASESQDSLPLSARVSNPFSIAVPAGQRR